MNSPSPPKRLWPSSVTVLLLLLVLSGIAGFFWYVWSQLGARADGTRVSLVMLGGTVGVASHGPLPIDVAADLAADGLKAVQVGIAVDAEQSFIFLREKVALSVMLTAGNQPVVPARLGYVLMDADGNSLSKGAVQPAEPIAAGQTAVVQIVDPDVANAARVEIRKLP
jgi:predicted permease